MSSSTVSITANPSNPSLRRPLPDPSSVNGKDLSHSIKPGAETLLERSRDAVDQTKNTLPTNSTTKLQKRTAVKKTRARSSSRPPWKKAVRMIIQNSVVFLILLLLAHMIRKLALNPGSDFDHEQRIVDFEAYVNHTIKMMQGDSDNYERRIAEVVKNTTKMMQGNFNCNRRIAEVVKNTTNMMLVQIAAVKSEIKSVSLEQSERNLNKFKDLDGKIVRIQRILISNEFKGYVEFIEKVIDDINKLYLDDIIPLVRDIVEKEISKHAADGLGRVDFAVASGGAYVLNHSPGSLLPTDPSIQRSRLDSRTMLNPSFGQPGECFALAGDHVFVDIRLHSAIIPEAITLEHVSESVAFDRSDAPKDCKVLGQSLGTISSSVQSFDVLLTEFTYDLEKSSAQTFDVLATETVVNTIRLEILSNHGSATQTCIYRVRVHGRPSLREVQEAPTDRTHPLDVFSVNDIIDSDGNSL